jgi:hypothetical protein
VNELCDRIVRDAECIMSEMLGTTWQEADYWLDVCCATNGTHIEIY